MKQYYRLSPRGFCNEDIILSAESAAEIIYAEEIATALNDAHTSWGERITRKDAERITAANRAACRRGEASANNPAGTTEIVRVADYIAQH